MQSENRGRYTHCHFPKKYKDELFLMSPCEEQDLFFRIETSDITYLNIFGENDDV